MHRLLIPTLISSCLLYGCLNATTKIDRLAQRSGFTKVTLEGAPFQHIVFTKPASNLKSQQSLHIYIEGDGSPWQRGTQIADDPTSKNPLSLHLMTLDTYPALYLGRPCYLGLSKTPTCNSTFWTSHRYAAEVVDSMAKAANEYIARHGVTQVSLMGHSGGGTLAVLLADKINKVSKIVTIAANLDTASWTRHHGYLPLTGSLNPIMDAQLNNIEHIHYVGGKDHAVPAQIIENFVNKKGGKLRVIEDFTHHCCWLDRWPQMLAE